MHSALGERQTKKLWKIRTEKKDQEEGTHIKENLIINYFI